MKKFFLMIMLLISSPKIVCEAVNTAASRDEFDKMLLNGENTYV